MHRFVIVALRALIVLIALLGLAGQIFVMPEFARDIAREDPRLLPVTVPYTIAAIATIAAVQVALLATWRLLTLVERRQIFRATARRWVDAIIIAAVIATLLVAAVAVHMLGIVQTGGAVALLLSFCLVVGGTTVTLLIIVMRGLLTTATSLRSELDEVV